jgi:tetratricopeptide (TPR) repeat protein
MEQYIFQKVFVSLQSDMKRIAYIFIVVGVLLGCGERQEYRDALSRAEAVMNDHPDSALLILDSLGKHEKEFGRHFRMQYLLHRTNAENKTDFQFTTDSLTKELVDHFDSHGTVNEQVLAHYLLGRAYSDMGEAPQAINSYQNAIDAADTTIADFNFQTLVCVYSQIAEIYHNQLLLTNEIEVRKKACHYAFRANKKRWGIYNQAMTAGAYILLNKKDSAEILLKSAIEQYRKYGYTQDALRYSRALLQIYTESPKRLSEAKALMDQFEAESQLFNEHHELPPSQRQYYDYKGKYYEGLNRLDSAEFYYRKIYRSGMSFTNQDPMYRGLLSVFSKRHQADSIAKYAQLYGMANDSSIALKDRELVAQMASLYNYNRSQKEAEQERGKTRETREILAVFILFAFLLIAVISWIYFRKQQMKKKKIRQLESELEKAMLTRREVQEELKQLKSQDYESVIAANEKKESELTQIIERLKAENDTFRSKERNTDIDHLEDFLESNIAQLFIKKAKGKTGRPIPSDAEWRLLESQFIKDMPNTFKSFGEGKTLSQLEQRICVLLILDISEKTISTMTDSVASTISNAKARANDKLFGKKEAHSLKTNLIYALRHS